MQTDHLLFKAGGRIRAIHAVAHSTYQGVADWYFLGDIEWPKGANGEESGALNREIPPYMVVTDGDAGKVEADIIFKAMSDYLLLKGKWHKPKSLKDGRQVSWTPKQKDAIVPIEELSRDALSAKLAAA